MTTQLESSIVRIRAVGTKGLEPVFELLESAGEVRNV